MRNHLLVFFLFFCSPIFAQQTVYKGFEADSAAEPVGGIAFLNTFIQANLRKPIAAEALGIGGRIILSGVVETDGHITEVKLMNTLRPDCDREALRVFKLFNSWKPAYKDGKPVLQEVNMPVFFKPNAPFVYEHGLKITYLDADMNLLPDSSKQVKFKQVAPIDTNGLPTGDLVLYKLVTNTWAEYARDSLVRKQSEQTDFRERPAYLIGHQLALQKLSGYLYTVDANGVIRAQNSYKEGKVSGSQLVYHANGALAEKVDYSENKKTIIAWYPNGQIQQVHELIMGSAVEPALSDRVTAVWDSTGRQFVKDGNGRTTYYKTVKSYTDKNQETSLSEQGVYKDYYKQGIWTGRYSDGSYFYEERYDKGVLLDGRSRLAGHDTVNYELEDRLPVFSGGMQGLKQFLNQNLRYPIGAQEARVAGQVVVSFVVCTDGTLCDYEIVKGVRSDIDREALRVVKKMSGTWIPGVQQGKKVRVKYNLPINFNL
ncbi:hypothetical protein GCM10028818_13370 [Spirosoma horti]